MTDYLVIIDGAGEYENDYSVLRIEATSAQDAIDQAIAPKMGYGKRPDATAFVIEESHVESFIVNDSNRRFAMPVVRVPL